MQYVRPLVAGALLLLASMAPPAATATAAGPARQLAFESVNDALVGTPIWVAVSVRDQAGAIATEDSTTQVTVSLQEGSGRRGAVLTCDRGTTQSAWSGMVHFGACRIDRSGRDYRLVATAPGLAPAVSPPFSVGPIGAGNGRYGSHEDRLVGVWSEDPRYPWESYYSFRVVASRGNGAVWGSVGRPSVDLGYLVVRCDRSTDTLVTVSVQGTAVAPATSLTLRNGTARFAGDLVVRETVRREPSCAAPWYPGHTETSRTLAVHVVASWTFDGWVRTTFCQEDPFAPPESEKDLMVIRTRYGDNVRAALAITGGIQRAFDPSRQLAGDVARQDSLMGLPDGSHPGGCTTGQ